MYYTMSVCVCVYDCVYIVYKKYPNIYNYTL